MLDLGGGAPQQFAIAEAVLVGYRRVIVAKACFTPVSLCSASMLISTPVRRPVPIGDGLLHKGARSGSGTSKSPSTVVR